MAQVTVRVNDRPWNIACGEGEEEHVRQLAARIEQQVERLSRGAGNYGDPRLLVMAGLVLAHEADESKAVAEPPTPAPVEAPSAEPSPDLTTREEALDRREAELTEVETRLELWHKELTSQASAVERGAKAIEKQKGELEARARALDEAEAALTRQREDLAEREQATRVAAETVQRSIDAHTDDVARSLEGAADRIEAVATRLDRP